MIEGQAEVHHRSDGEYILALSSGCPYLDDNNPFVDSTDTQDRRLGLVDDRHTVPEFHEARSSHVSY